MRPSTLLNILLVVLSARSTRADAAVLLETENQEADGDSRHLRVGTVKGAARRLSSSWQTDAFPVDDPIPEAKGDDARGRPLMHTFYDPVAIQANQFSTGMTEDSDKEIIEEWMAAWSAAGWEPKILTLDDAKRHPQFEKFNSLLEGVGMDYYNRLCMLRWLAMAASGGGWMSDYDTFPVNSFVVGTRNGDEVDPKAQVVLPSDGHITLFGDTVPCLVSGSAKEWDRMSRLLIEALFNFRMPVLSDMYGLIKLCEHRVDCPFVITRSTVILGDKVLRTEEYTQEDCDAVADNVAVHFAHKAIANGKEKGVLSPDTKMSDRPRIAREWIKMWHEKCEQKTVVI